ncbi:DUF4253 domain-containing protein [Actinacidiphila acididurans]|uniref:DUF4253 domain-containing protein n=1 Tax=Actinacidiphila acididurans TaxID=2784346 RepID=A0ABS2U435_9ACTN|nr:DUF4253 domain-containing protein [Actinacidiphila acididurans]MBM9510370.1 DUF4253 domain-containing protein [Actinacidiphila acididurans]
MNDELLRSLDVPLPPGRLIRADEGGGVPVLWLSDGPVPGEVWERLHAAHPGSGVWPLLLDSEVGGDDAFRPWETGELYPGYVSSPGKHDPGVLLAEWWSQYTAPDEDDDDLSAEERLAVTAPFGTAWPGLAPRREPGAEPGKTAAEFAHDFAAHRPQVRLGLVAAGRGSDALAAMGWSGPANYDNDTAKFAAVVRDWEQRFGARVVALDFGTLHLSVAAPPTTKEEALHVAAEHFAFCPDTIWQGADPNTLEAYAESIIGDHGWGFWWD